MSDGGSYSGTERSEMMGLCVRSREVERTYIRETGRIKIEIDLVETTLDLVNIDMGLIKAELDLITAEMDPLMAKRDPIKAERDQISPYFFKT